MSKKSFVQNTVKKLNKQICITLTLVRLSVQFYTYETFEGGDSPPPPFS